MKHTILLFAMLALSTQSALAADAATRYADQIQATETVAAMPWNQLSDGDWSVQAQRLFEMAVDLEKKGNLKDIEVRRILFGLWLQAGRAAENANDPSPPRYAQVGSKTVNVSWYRAASMAYVESSLIVGDDHKDLRASVAFYVDKISAGDLPVHTPGKRIK